MPKLISKQYIVQSKLLSWYKINKRILPWRKLKNDNLPKPYYVFISEFMLQQTTVNTVVKKFKEFIALYPNFKKLRKINENQILQLWSGLGYYSRAKNLLKSAKIINKKFKNVIPQDYDQLIDLPGVGDYTAKAILGIGYNKSFMPIDANIERVLSRLYGLKQPISSIKKKILFLAEYYISKNQSSNLIQAFMDFGSLVCTPRNPKCNICIIKIYCKSYAKNLQNLIPVKKKTRSKKLKKFSRAYIFSNEKNEILIRKRPSKGMLASMLEVPNDEWVKNKEDLVYDKIVINTKEKLEQKGLIQYSFSHFDLETEVFFSKVKKNHFSNCKWVKKNHVNKIGLPTIMKKIIELAT